MEINISQILLFARLQVFIIFSCPLVPCSINQLIMLMLVDVEGGGGHDFFSSSLVDVVGLFGGEWFW